MKPAPGLSLEELALTLPIPIISAIICAMRIYSGAKGRGKYVLGLVVSACTSAALVHAYNIFVNPPFL